MQNLKTRFIVTIPIKPVVWIMPKNQEISLTGQFWLHNKNRPWEVDQVKGNDQNHKEMEDGWKVVSVLFIMDLFTCLLGSSR